MHLSIAVGTYDRTLPVTTGRATIGDHTYEAAPGSLEQIFSAALGSTAYDVAELSFSNFSVQVAEGRAEYVGLPLFLSRGFRHSAIYLRKDAGITSPADLRGRRVGVREYTNTAALVVRGVLDDEYGVAASDIEWIVGDIDVVERSAIPVPDVPGTAISAVVGRDLSSLLSDGELDALVAYEAPRCSTVDGTATRLFEDFASVEREFYARTKVFPIMHLVGLRRELHEQDPMLAVEVADAFSRARDEAVSDLFVQQALKVSLPWTVAEAERTVHAMGEDFWSYGVDRNRHIVDLQLGWSRSQGLLSRPLTADDLLLYDDRIEKVTTARGPRS